MNVLDEDIPKSQRLLLESRGVRVRQIGVHIGWRGMADEAIPPMLLRHRRPTFFTRDEGFYDRSLCHAGYSLIYLDVNKYETAAFIRRVLRQKDLNTQAKRMGTVVRVSAAGLWVWRAHASRVARLLWKWSGERRTDEGHVRPIIPVAAESAACTAAPWPCRPMTPCTGSRRAALGPAPRQSP